MSKQFRDQSLAIVVVLRLKAGEFLPARARCGFDSEGASVFYTILLPSHRDSRVSLSLSARVTRIWTRWALNRCTRVFRKTERKYLLAWTCARELLSSVSRHSFLHVRPVDSCMCGSFITNSLKVCQMLLNITHLFRLNTHTYKHGNELQFWSLLRLARSFFH